MIARIHNDIKVAMKEKNTLQKDVLKMVLNKANALAKDAKMEIPTDEMVLDAVKKESKQIQDTIEVLVDNNKTDSELYKESIKKLDILAVYLPKQLTEDELRIELQNFIKEQNLDITNKGLLMKSIMPVFKSKADGKLINQVISSLI